MKQWKHPAVLGLMADSKPARLATLTRDIVGKFTRWKSGEVVNAKHVRGSMYLIEKLKPKRQGRTGIILPLLNSFSGVPRGALEFHEGKPNDKRRTQKAGRK